MKKFDPEKELSKIQNKDKVIFSNKSKFKGLFVPVLIFFCSCLVMIGASYSLKEPDYDASYTIKIDIINGQEDYYVKSVSGGAFMDTIYSNATFGGINCTEGSLAYDPQNHVIYSDNIYQDTVCILSFMNDGTKVINLASLNMINDNHGYSYYYKGDSDNNYFKFNGLMFRIVRVNGDGSLRLIFADSIGKYAYGDNNTFDRSEIVSILENWLNTNFKDNKYIIFNDYDTTKYYENIMDVKNLINFEGYSNFNVGLLSLREMNLINNGVKSSYLKNNMVLGNGFDLDYVWALQDDKQVTLDSHTALDIYPVINIKADIKGQGTESYPYEIDD